MISRHRYKFNNVVDPIKGLGLKQGNFCLLNIKTLKHITMKTFFTIACTFMAIVLTNGTLNAEKPDIKLKMFSAQGVSLEFLSKPEAEVEESFEFDPAEINAQTSKRASVLYNPIDITRFIKPEQEVEDLNFDTSAIFNEITGQVSVSK
jgi:hypothetical protein